MSGGHAPPSAEPTPGPSAGAVVLDIGGDVGAAVVVTPPSMDGLELEIRRAGGAWDGTHVAVRQRCQPRGQTKYAAVFPSLTRGTYELRVRFTKGSAVFPAIVVAGGQVTTAAWPLP
ncbi:MAG: phospholipase [Actinomycetota bacterium]|nr:phospholipase [Actinomycetota bacterium]